MPTEAIPFNDGQASGLEQLAGAPPLAVNVLSDATGATRMRPGISAWSDFPTIPNASPVIGMVPFGERLVYVTQDRKLFSWEGPGLVVDLSDSTAATKLDGASRPVMVALRDKVVAVGGGYPQKWTGLNLSSRLSGSPPIMTHILGNSTRLVGAIADKTGRMQWSGLGDTAHETWPALNFAEAEAKPDPLRALHENGNEVFAFGSETLQVFSPDPVTGYATGRALAVGLLAPYSVIPVDDAFAFLERGRRIVLTDGRGFSDAESVISKPIEATLRALSTVSDCWGFRMRTDRWDACVWILPTLGKGFIWDRRSNRWSEWREWSSAGYVTPTITSAVYWPERNLFLVGLSTGQIAQLDSTAVTDLGNTIRAEIVTGFINHGTEANKHCRRATFVFRRGQTAQTGTAPRVLISWRDDSGPYCLPVVANLGVAGDYASECQINSAGVYRRRQWKIEYTSAAEFTLATASEDFTVLPS